MPYPEDPMPSLPCQTSLPSPTAVRRPGSNAPVPSWEDETHPYQPLRQAHPPFPCPPKDPIRLRHDARRPRHEALDATHQQAPYHPAVPGTASTLPDRDCHCRYHHTSGNDPATRKEGDRTATGIPGGDNREHHDGGGDHGDDDDHDDGDDDDDDHAVQEDEEDKGSEHEDAAVEVVPSPPEEALHGGEEDEDDPREVPSGVHHGDGASKDTIPQEEAAEGDQRAAAEEEDTTERVHPSHLDQKPPRPHRHHRPVRNTVVHHGEEETEHAGKPSKAMLAQPWYPKEPLNLKKRSDCNRKYQTRETGLLSNHVRSEV